MSNQQNTEKIKAFKKKRKEISNDVKVESKHLMQLLEIYKEHNIHLKKFLNHLNPSEKEKVLELNDLMMRFLNQIAREVGSESIDVKDLAA